MDLFSVGKSIGQSNLVRQERKEYFAELEGREIKKDPRDITFGWYAIKWFEKKVRGSPLVNEEITR